jgi:hypothetical protein
MIFRFDPFSMPNKYHIPKKILFEEKEILWPITQVFPEYGKKETSRKLREKLK